MKMEKINLNELENVNGGTYGKSLSLVVRLAFGGYGKYMTDNAEIDFAGMKRFFASKGYKFIPSEDGQNIFVDREGLKYGQDYIENLIDNEKL